MAECLFCKIARGEIPAEKVYEDDLALAFRDIQPEAPVHLVVIPKKHISTLNDFTEADTKELAGFLLACQRAAKAEKVDKSGYRVVMNCNRDAGQFVFHVHAHVLGGRNMGWPPG
jgi:histidine triad (HIT) family protein